MLDDAQAAVTPEVLDTTTTPLPDAGAPKPPPAAPLTPPDAGKVDDLPEWAKALIGDLRKENAGHRTAKKRAETEAEEAARKAAEDQGKFKDLYEAALRKQQEAETEATRLRLEALKSAVAAKVGLPTALALRLQGEDEAAIEQDAKLLLASLPRQTVSNDAAAGTGGGGTAAPSMTEEQIKEFAARMGVDPKFVKPEMFKLPAKGNK
jgi:hypothetical protein